MSHHREIRVSKSLIDNLKIIQSHHLVKLEMISMIPLWTRLMQHKKFCCLRNYLKIITRVRFRIPTNKSKPNTNKLRQITCSLLTMITSSNQLLMHSLQMKNGQFNNKPSLLQKTLQTIKKCSKGDDLLSLSQPLFCSVVLFFSFYTDIDI